MKNEYKNLNELGVIIYSEPYPHIKPKELHKILKKNKISVKKFNKFFGINTCLLLDDGTLGLYPIDVELTLSQILQNYKPMIADWD